MGTRGLFVSSYVFQDREAGIFYQSFEDDFRRFIAYKFGVDMAPMAMCGTSPAPGGSGRAPANKVDFTG